MNETYTEKQIKGAVRQTYGDLARRHLESPGQGTRRTSCCGPSAPASESKSGGCCSGSKQEVVESAGGSRFYPTEELADLPETVTGASAGCGNPLALAELQPGEVVLDLGSGGGIDCFLAARKVGAEGKVIGLDMTPEMINLARRNAKKIGLTNVDFRYGEMEEMPLPDESVDVIISNCVINLSPDKDAVFHEAYRVLRPGGRMHVSDIVVDGQLPEPIRDSLNAWAGCIAGALDEADYLAKIRAAGFERVGVLSRQYAEAEMAVDSDLKEAEALLEGSGLTPQDLARKVASVQVRAHKPA